MIRTIHRAIKEWPPIRRARGPLGRWYGRLIGRPDAWSDLARIIRAVRPAAVLDVGSHTGGTVIRFTDAARHIPVHAFEPTPGSAALLRQKTAGIPNVRVHEIALSDCSGTVRFFLNRFEQTNSLLDNAPGVERSPLAEHVDRIDVASMRLDDWCEANVPAGDLVIKADIQGAEGLLLAGGGETFSRGRVAAFYSEVLYTSLYEHQASFQQLHETLMNRFDMALWQIYRVSRDQTGRAAWGDAMWVREDVLPRLR
jgi:FkbM family methyltransferase